MAHESETKRRQVIIDSALAIVIATSLLYLFGKFTIGGTLDELGLSLIICKPDFYAVIQRGFTSLILTPFYGTSYFLLSLLFLSPFITEKFTTSKIRFFKFIHILLIIAFIIFLSVSCHQVGEKHGREILTEISKAYNGNTPKDNFITKTIVQYSGSDNKIQQISGYNIYIPGEYIIVALQDEIIAIREQNIHSITFEGKMRTKKCNITMLILVPR